MSAFSEWNGPEARGGPSSGEMLSLVQKYETLAAELHAHMQKTVGFAEESVTASKGEDGALKLQTTSGFVHGIKEVLDGIVDQLNNKASGSTLTALSGRVEGMSADVQSSRKALDPASEGSLASRFEELSKSFGEADSKVAALEKALNGGASAEGALDKLSDLEGDYASAAQDIKALKQMLDGLKHTVESSPDGDILMLESVLSSAKHLLGILHACNYIDFTKWARITVTQYAGTGSSEDTGTEGLYLLGRLSDRWDDDGIAPAPKSCRAYIKYINSEPFDAVVDVTVTEGMPDRSAAIHALVSRKSTSYWKSLKFHVVHATASGKGAGGYYLAMSSVHANSHPASLSMYMAGINIIPLGMEGAPLVAHVTTSVAYTTAMPEDSLSAMLISGDISAGRLAAKEYMDGEGHTILKAAVQEGSDRKVLEVGSQDVDLLFSRRPMLKGSDGLEHALVTSKDVERLVSLPAGTIVQWPAFEEIKDGEDVVMRRAINVPAGWHATDGTAIPVLGNEAIAEKGMLPYTDATESGMLLPLQDFSIIKTSTNFDHKEEEDAEPEDIAGLIGTVKALKQELAMLKARSDANDMEHTRQLAKDPEHESGLSRAIDAEKERAEGEEAHIKEDVGSLHFLSRTPVYKHEDDLPGASPDGTGKVWHVGDIAAVINETEKLIRTVKSVSSDGLIVWG